MKTRKKYAKEFKMDAVSEQDYIRAESATNLVIKAHRLGRWVKEYQAEEGQSFRGNGRLTPEQEGLRKMKAQVKRLEMERDII